MRRVTVLLACIALLLPGALAAFETTWGVTLDGSAGFSYAGHQDENDPSYTITSAIWSRSLFALGLDRSIELLAQGSYTWTDDRPYLFDVDLLRAAGRYPGLLGPTSVVRATAGRFQFRDTTGIVLNHVADGMQARVNYPGLRTRAAIGYTGLLLNPVSDIRMTMADLADGGDDDELFGPRRIVALGEVSFPEVYLRQTVTVGLTSQFDLRDADDDEATLNTGYLSLALAGPLVANVYHSLSGTVMFGKGELGDDSENLTGLMADARIRYYREDLLSSRIGLGLTWASGAGDDLDRFVPISRSTAGTILNLPVENLLRGEVSYSIQPVPRVQTEYTVGWFFTADKDDRPETIGVQPQPDGRWLGTEVTTRVSARITSDLGLSVTGGVFAPSSGDNGVFTNTREAEYLLRIDVSTGF
ncbi:MAG: hypothetical protein EA427_00085 [Spirochaetaceae bacterium]|nr:MAG: hypothetical protein EA427_00085 [Spirochaetaceae bacterium]